MTNYHNLDHYLNTRFCVATFILNNYNESRWSQKMFAAMLPLSEKFKNNWNLNKIVNFSRTPLILNV